MRTSLGHLFGIDLGTSNTLIFQKGKGIVLKEPSVIAVDKKTGEVEAVGEQALAMIGRAPDNLDVIYPLQDGVIANFDMTTEMLKHFISKIMGGRKIWFHRASVVISIPCGVTNVQKRAVEETLMHRGAKRALTVQEPLAAALGGGLPIAEPIGNMVIDIGGGLSQVAVLSLGDIAVSHAAHRGGRSIDKEIMDYMKKNYKLEIGARTAEGIKIHIGSAVIPENREPMQIKGRDMVSGLPKSILVAPEEIHELLNPFIATLVELMRITLEKCPPELAGDVMERGIMLCGGGALLQGLDRRLQMETQVAVHRAENPLECIALGLGKIS